MVMEFDYNQVLEHVQMNNIVLAAAGDGVVSGLDVSERGAGVNMSVDVATGSAHINGTTHTESSIVNLAISTADATHARKDLVIYDVATTEPLVITGSPATPPIPPDITAGDILLAIVNVAANETEITNSEIVDSIIEVTKLDELAAPSDSTTLDASTAVHGLLKKLSNSSAEFMNGQGNWATPAGAGDMTKAVYDTDNNGMVDDSDKVDGCHAGNSALQVAVSNGTLCSTLNADKVDGCDAGNSASQVAVSNGTLCSTLNADKVDGCDAGVGTGTVLKIPSTTTGTIWQYYSTIPGMARIYASTTGYLLNSNGAGNLLTWEAASDLIFSDTHCPKCGKEFQDGDNLILHVIGHNEVGDILTLPMHSSCANEPKKTVTLQRKVMEARYILD